jgi:hypothetical protein
METVLVCILPPLELRQQLRQKMEEYSRQLNSRKALTFPPKITLVNRFRTNQYDAFVQRCKEICSKTGKFTIDLGPGGKFEEPPILYLAVQKNGELQQLHEDLIEACAEYRQHWERPNFKDLSQNEQQRSYLERYGSLFVKEYYEPHVTFAGPDVDPDLFEEIEPSDDAYTITADKVYVLRETRDGWKIDVVIPLA